MKTTKDTDTIRDLLNECVEEAQEQGYEGDFEDYEFTVADLDYVTDELGRKPTREEWEEAGLKWVGGAHVA